MRGNAGFAIEEHVFSVEECEELLRALAHVSGQRSRAGIRHLMANPEVSELARDPRLLAIARQSLGLDAIPFRATLFDKSAKTNWLIPWHQDTALPLTTPFDLPDWGPWSRKSGVEYSHAPGWALARVVALRVHLDASTANNGPLRVIPGSHLAGVLSDDAVYRCVNEPGNEIAECTARRGGVIAMRPLIIHSSSKALNSDPRRVLHIEYADSLDFGPGIRLAIS